MKKRISTRLPRIEAESFFFPSSDPNQLPPTVMSQAAERYNYSESMFVRIQRKSPHNVHLLS